MMFQVLLFVCVAASVTTGVPVYEQTPLNSHIIEFPGGDGQMHVVDLSEPPNMEVLNEIQRNPANNLYLLFTKHNQDTAQLLVMNDENSIRTSLFDPRLETVVIAHGWLNNQNSDLNTAIRSAYLEKRDVNVIVVDWRRLATSGYVTAANGVPNLGRGLGLFLRFLNTVTGAPFSNMHLIGFSLGAHLVGNAGRELNGQIARITGLDPAGPLWHYNSNRLSAADAVYVEAIHTDGPVLGIGLGIGTAVGHADFFPNGGNSQPGCLTGICGHNRAWEFFASTVTHNHLIANKCENSWQLTWNSCRGTDQLPMGNDNIRKKGLGMYRVNTGRRYPF